MSVSRDEVRRMATLARLGLADERLDTLARELSSIIGHMDALRAVDSSGAAAHAEVARPGMPLRPDVPGAVPLDRAREEFAPATRDGFFLVPRLASHDGEGGSA
jgi:aspartyl-tRNA(Asn)/glutamyl-tRNA(Gln) amidotransferase subunit C